MNEFKFKTAKGSEVTLSIIDGKRCLSVGSYVNLPYVEVDGDLRADSGEKKIIVPVPSYVREKMYDWSRQGSVPIVIKGTVKCVGCGNLKYDAEPKEYNCEYCDEPMFHKLVA